MTNKLWQASQKTILDSELFRFENYISKKLNTKFRINFDKIHKWSVKNIIDKNPIKNKEALANPKALEQFKNIRELYY
jgi:hypothetical protein